MMQLTGRTDRWVKTNLTTMCEHILSFVAEKNDFSVKNTLNTKGCERNQI